MTTPTLDKPARPATPPPAPEATRTPLARGLLWTGGIIGAVSLLWGAAQVVDLAKSSTEYASATYDAAPVVELVADGRVGITPGDAGEIQVDRTQRSGWTSPVYEVAEGGDRLVVRNTCGSWFGVCSGSLDVQVPEGTEVVVRSSNGRVHAAGLVGPLDLQTSDGRIEVTHVDGDVRLRTSNGGILVDDVSGAVEARTSDGRIDVNGVGGHLDAVTSNGGVQVGDVGGDARVRTSDGSVEVSGVDGDVEAVTSNGHVTVFGTGEPVALTISTSNGRQTVDAPTDPSASRTVFIRTSDGNVSYLGPR
ncbi:DUF4097 family beta strand repeat-containing protein [Cellulomonas biazotea]|uniref:DUF4097 domain-containing protein n=1 Tax=Cellulomonas biazotea TaxID=1709 RepID=A0A402DMM3_9CELL|nr:DUF4097 family beta strand repeat protein [Cellulomonas biazotea]GCE75338.1 hypothetical protein CBZ_03940 [Cellulomonas biazotea]